MKKIIVFAIVLVITACNDSSKNKPLPEKKRNFGLSVYNGSGWTSSNGNVECDSFKMLSNKEAEIWIDGYKSIVKCETYITPYSK